MHYPWDDLFDVQIYTTYLDMKDFRNLSFILFIKEEEGGTSAKNYPQNCFFRIMVLVVIIPKVHYKAYGIMDTVEVDTSSHYYD